MLKPVNYPCWLTVAQLEEAQALINIGFGYCGKVEDFVIESSPLSRIGAWTFFTCPRACNLDACCNGALYSWVLEIHPQCFESGFLEARLKEAKQAIRCVRQQRRRRESQFKQLSLFSLIP